MHLYITARHFELTDAIRRHVEEHIVRAVQAHSEPHDLNRIEVQLDVGQRDARFGCHVLVQLPGHRDLNVTETNKDLYAAIDCAEKRLLSVLVDARRRALTARRHPREVSAEGTAGTVRSAR